jgi:hypothetical protein
LFKQPIGLVLQVRDRGWPFGRFAAAGGCDSRADYRM